MISIEFSIWIASKTRWAHLVKTIDLPAVPRMGEFVKFHNDVQGDYFAWKVSQVTYRETGQIEVWTELLDNVNDRNYSFEQETEFDDYYHSYIAEGWSCERAIVPNRRYQRPES